ncbi:MAG: FkbM family methyltransferase [Anaerolineaceae bacterium]|nr:FkbM family methyltransferase [Anaerolineaceae bacterium]
MIFDKLLTKNFANISYSQCGEDLIINYIFHSLGNSHPSYIDIGAHHPFRFSNTAYFYNKKCRGINIEPDPSLIKSFLRSRPKDINLNFGVSTSCGIMDFYIMSSSTLNTFSLEVAKSLERDHGFKIKSIEKIRVYTISNIIDHYNGGKFPDFLSIDVEGLDFDILKSIDYSSNPPTVICVETISYSETGHGEKAHDIINYLQDQGYLLYADTNVNTIFVKRALWER